MMSVFFCTLLICIPAYAFNDSLIGKTEDQVLSKFGEPDMVVEPGPGIIKFIYGDPRTGAKDWAEFFITDSLMFIFKKGKVVGIEASFGGYVDNDGIPKEFPRLKEHMSMAITNIKPVLEKGSAKWSGITWNGTKYNYWARCITKDIAFNKSTKGFKLTDIKRIEDYYLVQYEILENNYYKGLKRN